MEWFVFYFSWNERKIEPLNIFNHGSFNEEVKKLLKKDLTREEFDEALRKELLYYFWAKYEYEVIISSLSEHDNSDTKVDIYKQVMLNFDRFADYVWSFHKPKKARV